ncbi:unnamed protein product [Acanthoscelides obtectus]|uniref:Uncharacterized protein n=1 Tax=Acanthoscelides obtectus TaxID=200917 RepID=A0A9P0PPM4_ACAOB|nr:unnamed protein product [Acanthoscelides obtectus]CAK1671765.1 hypothetical protein AOBTE_LOCUS28447 [Acanthoscelides obtectus]
MDSEIPRPSRPKIKLEDPKRGKLFSDSELEALAYLSESDEKPFVDSGSEYEPDYTSSSEQEEIWEHAMIPETSEEGDRSEVPMWADNPGLSIFRQPWTKRKLSI